MGTPLKNYFYTDLYVNNTTFSYFTELAFNMKHTPQRPGVFYNILSLPEKDRNLRDEGVMLHSMFLEKKIYFQYALKVWIPYLLISFNGTFQNILDRLLQDLLSILPHQEVPYVLLCLIVKYDYELRLTIYVGHTAMYKIPPIKENNIVSFIKNFIIKGGFTCQNDIHLENKLKFCRAYSEDVVGVRLFSLYNYPVFIPGVDWYLIPQYANYLHKTTNQSKEETIQKIYLECNNKYIMRWQVLNLCLHYTDALLDTEDVSFLSEFYKRLGLSSRVFVWPAVPKMQIVDMVISEIDKLVIFPFSMVYATIGVLFGSYTMSESYIHHLQAFLKLIKNEKFFNQLVSENIYGDVTKNHLDALKNSIDSSFCNELRASFMDGAISFDSIKGDKKLNIMLNKNMDKCVYKKITHNKLYTYDQFPTTLDSLPVPYMQDEYTNIIFDNANRMMFNISD